MVFNAEFPQLQQRAFIFKATCSIVFVDSFLKPINSPWIVFPTDSEKIPKRMIRKVISLSSRLTQPFLGFIIVFGYAVAELIAEAKQVLGYGVPLFSGF